MKPLQRYSVIKLDLIPESNIELREFDPEYKKISDEYIATLSRLLKWSRSQIRVRGSTAFEIMGKGDIDICIFPPDKNWYFVVKQLMNYYEHIIGLEEEYASFDDIYKGVNIEIVVLRNYAAKVEKALFHAIKKDNKLIKKYILLKKKYAFSRRKYLEAKNAFFSSIIRFL